MIFDLEKKIRDMNDSLFERLIEIEFLPDLNFAKRLSNIPYHDRTPHQNFLWVFLREKYPANEKCPSNLYCSVSKPLRRRYNIIHRQMLEILH